MDKSWQKNLLAFLGLAAAILGVAAYLIPRAPTPTSSAPPYELDSRLRHERKALVELMDARNQGNAERLDAIKTALQDFKQETREALKSINDQLLILRRQEAAKITPPQRPGG